MTSSHSAPPDSSAAASKSTFPKRLAVMAGVSVVGLGLSAALLVVFGLALAYPNLPELDTLTDYRPKMPLRIFSADNVLIGEFGEERRNLVRFKDIPDVMKKAVLAIEDDRFYEHGGVDYLGIARAALHNAIGGGGKQGASTITQQVARNFFLSSEQTIKRKAYEMLLAWKIEKNLSKDQILEVYMNQIYLGQRAYGFSSAAQIYFGKNLKDISVAEAAMLAGLPKAPSAYNPVVNPKRARARQQYILQRMHDLGYISDKQYEQAKAEELKVKTDSSEFGVHAEYVAELARQLVYEQFKEDTYTRGPERVHHHHQGRPGRRLPGAAQGRNGLREAPRLSRPGSLYRHPAEQGRSRRRHRNRTGRPPRQRRHHRRHGATSDAAADRGRDRLGRGNQDQRRRPGHGPRLAVGQEPAQQAHPSRRRDPRHAGRRQLGSDPDAGN